MMFRRIIDPGSNKRILYLGANDTIRYLVLQSLDMVHDAMGSKKFNSEINVAKFIVNALANWIYMNNQNLHWLKFNDFSAYMLNNFLSYWRGSVDSTINHMRSQKEKVPIRRDSRNVVVDQCNQGKPSAIYCTNSQRIIITQSVLYDSGASTTNCGKLDIMFTKNVPRPMAFDDRYVSDMRVQKMVAARPIYECKGISVANGTIDNCISGVFIINGNRYPIICAQMGVCTVNLEGRTCSQYCHTITPGNICQRGYAPSNKMLEILYQAVNDQYPVGTDLLLVYTELAAKHWGDLGLVFDVLASDVFLISQDRVIKLLCEQFGANCMDEEFEYVATVRASSDVLFIVETNSASIFGRY